MARRQGHSLDMMGYFNDLRSFTMRPISMVKLMAFHDLDYMKCQIQFECIANPVHRRSQNRVFASDSLSFADYLIQNFQKVQSQSPCAD